MTGVNEGSFASNNLSRYDFIVNGLIGSVYESAFAVILLPFCLLYGASIRGLQRIPGRTIHSCCNVSVIMELIALNCRNCGAPLQVPKDLKHVTCMHCGTQLAVVHEGGAAYTEKLDQLAERTDEIEDKLEELHREQKIAALDREWDVAQEGFKVRRKDGSTYLPSKTGSIMTGVAGVGVGLFIMLLGIGTSAGSGPGGVFILVGCVAMLAGVGATIWQYHRADAYEKAKLRYQRRRQQIRRG